MTKKHLLLSSLAMVIIFFTLFSCREETKFGYEILPDSDKYEHLITDTVTVELYTQKDDTVITSHTTNLLVGSSEDPVFGYTSASSLMQFRLPLNNVLDTGFVVDSVVLILQYSSDFDSFGESSVSQKLNFFKSLSGDATTGDSIYYSWEPNIYAGGDLIGSTIVKPQTGDSISPLRVKLNDDFSQSLFQAIADTLDTNDELFTFLPGVYMEPDDTNTKASILSFDSEKDSIKVYYHTAIDAETTGTYVITTDNKSGIQLAHMNFFTHNYEPLPFYSLINETTIPATTAYIQSMAGLRAWLKFPHLGEWAKQKDSIVIHRAELLLPAIEKEGSSLEDYPPSPSVFFAYSDAEGNRLLPIVPSTYSSTEGEYSFDMADHLSGIIAGTDENNGVVMSILNSARSNNRAVISTEDAANKVRLVITYAKLP